MKTFKTLLLVIFSIVALDSCSRNTTTMTREDESTEVLTFGRAKKNIVLENQTGSIDITGTDASQDIFVRIVRRASGSDSGDAETHIEDVKISKETTGEDIIFKTEYPGGDDRKYSVSYFIVVPKYSNITIKQENGDINVKNTANNSLKIESGSGEININNVWAREMNVESGNGNLTADFWPLENSTAEFELGNGNAKISIPANSNASIDVNNENGAITNEGLPWLNSSPSKNQFSGVLGTGKSVIKCSVGNGNIFLRSSGNQFEIPSTSQK
ncbi:MAG: DUF4097 family beta strand repeat-containing protein [Bacteroidota bacterium]